MADGDLPADQEKPEFDEFTTDEEVATEQLETPAAPNGNGHASPPLQAASPTVQRQETITYPTQTYTPPTVRHNPRRPLPRRESQRELTHRDIIQNICELPESDDWEFRVTRVQSRIRCADGSLPRYGELDTYDTMPADTLYMAIQSDWGGGEYKIVTRDKATHGPVMNQPKVRSVFFHIEGPSLNDKNSGGVVDDTGAPIEVDDELKMIERDKNIAMQEERRNSAQMRRLKSEAAVMEVKKSIRDMQRDENGGGGNSQIELLKVQLENDRKMSEERARNDRETFMSALKILGEQVAKVAELAARPAPAPIAPLPDRTPELMASLQKSQSDLLTALLPALIRKEEKGPDNGLEFIKMSQDNTRMIFDTLNKQGSKESSTERELMKSMMNQMIQMVTSPKLNRQDGISAKDMLDMVAKTRKETLDMVNMIRGEDDTPAEGIGWDDKKGLGANLFGMLKEVISLAVGSPGGQAVLMKIFNKSNPTDQDALLLAQQTEAEQMQLMAGQQPQQLVAPQVQPMQPVRQQQQPVRPMQPIVTPPPMVTGVPSVAIPQRQVSQIPRQQPQQAGVPSVGVPKAVPVAVPAAPARTEPTPAPTPAENATTQADVNAELEADVSGVGAPSETVSVPVRPWPDPPAGPLSPNEAPVPPPSEPEPAVVPQPVVAAAPTPEQVASQQRLRERVTEAMMIAIDNVKDEIAVHEWPQLALEQWNGPFLAYLRGAPNDEVRLRIIQGQCDPVVFKTLYDTLQGSTAKEPPQWTCMFDGVRALL